MSTEADSGRATLHDRLESVLDAHVRPGLQADGGGIELVSVDTDNIAQVRLLGACQGCSASVYPVVMAVESTVKQHLPEIRFLEAVL